MGLGKTYSTKYLADSNNNTGAAGQVLSTTSTGIDWADANTLPGAGLWLENGNDIYNSNSGKVGIGTASPAGKFEIKSAASSNATAPAITFTDDTGVADSRWILGNIGTTNYGNFVLAESDSATTVNYSPRITVMPGGNVGIGTNSPDQKLHIKGGDIQTQDTTGLNGVLRIRSTITGGITYGYPNVGAGDAVIEGGGTTQRQPGVITLMNGGSSISSGQDLGVIQFAAKDDSATGYCTSQIISTTNGTPGTGASGGGILRFLTSLGNAGSVPVERMRIGNTGNVGIGTTNPGFKLQVGDNGVADGNIAMKANGTGADAGAELTFNMNVSGGNADSYIAQIVPISYDSLSSGTHNSLNFKVGTWNNNADAGVSRMTILSNGHVGIGTTNPVAKLHVYQNDTEVDTEAGVTIEQDGTGDAALSFLLTGTKRWRMGIDNNDSDKFKISDSTNLASNNKLTIDTSGNVGIGTTSPGAKLQVGSRGTASPPSIPATNGILFDFYNDGNPYTRHASIISQASDLTEAVIDFYTKPLQTTYAAATKKMTIRGNGDVRFNSYTAGTLVTDANGNISAATSGLGTAAIEISGGLPVYNAGITRAEMFDLLLLPEITAGYNVRSIGGSTGLQITSGSIYENGAGLSIGDTSPITGVKLKVVGATFQTGDLLLSDDDTYSPEIKMTNSTHTIGIDYQSNETLRFITRSGVTAVPITFQMRAGTITAINFILSSDERKKTKVKDLSRDSISVNWKSFEMKENEGEYRTGVIAQELEEKHPEFVRTDDEGMKSVAYIDLLIAKIAELEARLEKAGI